MNAVIGVNAPQILAAWFTYKKGRSHQMLNFIKWLIYQYQAIMSPWTQTIFILTFEFTNQWLLWKLFRQVYTNLPFLFYAKYLIYWHTKILKCMEHNICCCNFHPPYKHLHIHPLRYTHTHTDTDRHTYIICAHSHSLFLELLRAVKLVVLPDWLLSSMPGS